MNETLTEEEAFHWFYQWYVHTHTPGDTSTWTIVYCDEYYRPWPNNGSIAQVVLQKTGTEEHFAFELALDHRQEPVMVQEPLYPVKKVAYTTYSWNRK